MGVVGGNASVERLLGTFEVLVDVFEVFIVVFLPELMKGRYLSHICKLYDKFEIISML